MLISDIANAGEAVAPGEDTRFYDDIGCLAKGGETKPGTRLFVRLANGAGWADVDRAWFALTSGGRTPMGYGVSAFLTESDARSADVEAVARTWSAIVVRMKGR